MDYLAIFNAVKDEYDEDTAIMVVVMQTLNMAKKVHPRHLNPDTIGVYTEELKEEIRMVLWDRSLEEIDKAWRIKEALNLYHSAKEMDGLGGCVKKTLKEFANV